MRVYEWAKENGVKADMKTLAESNELKEIILFQDMVDQGKIGGLKGFEQVIQNQKISLKKLRNSSLKMFVVS